MSDDQKEPYFFKAIRPSNSFNVKSEDWPKFLTSCIKSAISFAHGNYFSTVSNLLTAFGAKPSVQQRLGGQEQAWLLIQRSTIKAIVQSLRHHRHDVSSNLDSIEACPQHLIESIDCDEFTLPRDFLQDPATADFVTDVGNAFDRFLDEQKVTKEKIKAIKSRFVEELYIYVDSELRDNQDAYDILEGTFRQTFTDDAAERARRWQRYRNILIDNVRQPVLEFNGHKTLRDSMKSDKGADDILVPLNELFVWPIGSYNSFDTDELGDEDEKQDEISIELSKIFRSEENQTNIKKVHVWLRSHICNWLNDPIYEIQVVTGEAGLGKTSFVKNMAAEVAANNGYPIYVPVNSLRFDDKRSAWNAIVNYISMEVPDRLGFEPAFEKHSQKTPIILVIDGLDELSRSGESAEEAARTFLESLKESLREINDNNNKRILVILAGRPKVTVNYGGQYHHEGQIVFIERLGQFRMANGSSDDRFVDLRARWWKNFRASIDDVPSGELSNESMGWIPKELVYHTDKNGAAISEGHKKVTGGGIEDESDSYYSVKPKYQEFLDQPLLSYFVAILLYTDQRRFQSVETRADLFEEMFNFFYVRQKAKEQRSGSGLQHVFAKQDRYRYLLELIALAAWRRGDRSVESGLVDSIFQSDREARKILYAAFDEEVSYGVHIAPIASGVINSFFVGKDQDQPAGVFEFTHKAFREYLSTSRLVRVAVDVCEGINDHSYSSHEASLSLFREYWGCQTTPDIIDFLREILARDGYDLGALKGALERLLNHVVVYGAPAEILKDSKSGKEVEERSCEIELLILALLSSCWSRMIYNQGESVESQDRVHESLYISVPCFNAQTGFGSDRFGNWLHRIRGQTESWWIKNKLYIRKGSIPLMLLSGLDLSGANLVNQDFESAMMANSCLRGANLLGAVFTSAVLENVDFTGADLRKARFDKAYIKGAVFTDAYYDDGQFDDCMEIEGAQF